jgi:sulfate transport system permease protein
MSNSTKSATAPAAPIPTRPVRKSAIPGLGLSLGYTVLYLGLIVLLPLSATFLKASGLGWEGFWKIASSARAIASYKLTFGVSLAAAGVNLVFGLLLAWVLVRYRFPGRKIMDAVIDLPFALPTAVAGIALTAIYGPNGWFGQYLYKVGIQSAYTPVGIFIALTFIGLPFVVRTVQPVLEDLDQEVEEAAATLGAGRFRTVFTIILPALLPALLAGFAMAFARAVGEYGSVVFISGNLPMKTEITPLLIYTYLEEFNYAGATTLAVVMLLFSFVLLLIINVLQRWAQRATA